MPGDSQRLVRVGRITKAHGIRGEVMVRPDDSTSTSLLSQSSVFLRMSGEEARPACIEASRPAHEAWLVRFEGCEDRTAAEKYVGLEVLLPRGCLPELEEGEFYADDLLGLQVRSVDGADLGKVMEVIDAGAVPVLEIVGDRRFQVPLADTFVRAIDLEAGIIEVVPPEEEEGGG